jgi:hypothetical protein
LSANKKINRRALSGKLAVPAFCCSVFQQHSGGRFLLNCAAKMKIGYRPQKGAGLYTCAFLLRERRNLYENKLNVPEHPAAGKSAVRLVSLEQI